MGVLEQVMDLKNKGVSDNEIVVILKEKGASPKSISDALSQAKIKGAVSSQEEKDEEMEPSVMGPEESEDLPTEGSISDEDLTPIPSGLPSSMQQRGYVPMHQEAEEENYAPQPIEQQEEYSPPLYSPAQQSQQSPSYQYQPQEYTQQEYAPQEGYEYPTQTTQGAADIDTIIEISEQVFADKMKLISKQIESFNEFKTLSSIKIDNISERLKRMEMSIDKLQIAILEKIGSYGRGIDTLKKEMEMVQSSFSKVVNATAEKSNETRNMQSYNRKYQQRNEQPQQAQNTQQPLQTIQRIEKKTTVVHKSSPEKKISKSIKKK